MDSSLSEALVTSIDVTMVQRGPTYIMSIKNGWDVLFKGGYVEGGPPVEVVDRVAQSMPHFMAADFNVIRARQIAEMDKCALFFSCL